MVCKKHRPQYNSAGRNKPYFSGNGASVIGADIAIVVRCFVCVCRCYGSHL